MTLNKHGIEELLSQVFDDFQRVDDPAEHTRRKQEFILHMTDWASELEKMAGLYRNPHQQGPDAGKIVAGFLYHAIPHLNTAGRLLLDRIPDPFSEPLRLCDPGV
jgi:hypothetical protein